MTTFRRDRRTHKRALLAAMLLAAAAVCTVAVAQQLKKTKSAEIRAASMTYNWDTNTFEFVGKCRLDIKGGYEANMTGPKMTAKLSKKGDRVDRLTAGGPVHFELTTQADANGVQRKIVADAKGDATYEEATQAVTLNGGAVADVTTLPVTPDSESAHFEGERIVANLKANTITVEKAYLKATATPETQ